MLTNFISSHKDLPVYVYDIRTVFRNETRAKSGIMRGREFFWKALYSFSRNEAEHKAYYEKAKDAYFKILERCGLKDKTYLTFASGGSFSRYSHEFQAVCEAGEDTIYVDEKKKIAVNKEVYTDEVIKDLGLDKEELVEKKAIEVGNIFSLGHKFSEPFNLKYKDENGEDKFVFMGSYGLGSSRLMGTIVELFHDDKGIIWPEAVAPYQVHLLKIKNQKSKIKIDEEADKIYKSLLDNKIEVLYDEREVSAGEKFADTDLIGIPYRIVVSEKSLQAGGAEVKKRNETEGTIVKGEELARLLAA
jgi:prolyl-tRNA synthetase